MKLFLMALVFMVTCSCSERYEISKLKDHVSTVCNNDYIITSIHECANMKCAATAKFGASTAEVIIGMPVSVGSKARVCIWWID